METLTRVLARHVYSLDLADLPLDRLLQEQKNGKRGRKRTNARCTVNVGSVPAPSVPCKLSFYFALNIKYFFLLRLL